VVPCSLFLDCGIILVITLIGALQPKGMHGMPCECMSESNGFCIIYWLEQLSKSVGVQISTSFDLDEARRSYFTSLFPLNPGGIVPIGPTIQDLALHREAGRGSHSAESVFHLQAVPSVVAA
jgi:hypothetical protein